MFVSCRTRCERTPPSGDPSPRCATSHEGGAASCRRARGSTHEKARRQPGFRMPRKESTLNLRNKGPSPTARYGLGKPILARLSVPAPGSELLSRGHISRAGVLGHGHSQRQVLDGGRPRAGGTGGHGLTRRSDGAAHQPLGRDRAPAQGRFAPRGPALRDAGAGGRDRAVARRRRPRARSTAATAGPSRLWGRPPR